MWLRPGSISTFSMNVDVARSRRVLLARSLVRTLLNVRHVAAMSMWRLGATVVAHESGFGVSERKRTTPEEKEVERECAYGDEGRASPLHRQPTSESPPRAGAAEAAHPSEGNIARQRQPCQRGAMATHHTRPAQAAVPSEAGCEAVILSMVATAALPVLQGAASQLHKLQDLVHS